MRLIGDHCRWIGNEASDPSSGPDELLGKEAEQGRFWRRERVWVTVLCFLAALRILFFCAIFPFFNNVDEQAHFDLIWKYAHNQWPVQGSDTLDPASFRIVRLVGSPEYISKPSDHPEGRIPPPVTTWPAEHRQRMLDRGADRVLINHEEYSPPVYYWLTGRWLRLGEGLGLQNAGLLYWSRFLNALLYGLIVILTYMGARRVFPSPSQLPLAVLVIAAFIPQDVFYGFNSDVLSPLLSTVAILLLLRCLQDVRSPWYVYGLLGISLALTVLVKTSNFPLLALPVAALGVAAWIARTLRPSLRLMVNCLLTALGLAIPMALWIRHNLAVTGDWSGAGPKIAHLGWTSKSLGEIYPHPVFTFAGFSHFIHGLFQTFWRGELRWHSKAITWSWLDYVFSIGTSALLLASLGFVLHRFVVQRRSGALMLAQISVLGAVAFIALLSLLFDFHDCLYPSGDDPFFLSGRLMLWAFLPMLLCLGYGLKRLLELVRLGRCILPFTIAFMMAVTLQEFWLHRHVWGSLYNFLHLPLGEIP